MYEGWIYHDGCVVCPRCNAFISCDPDIPSMLSAIPGHDCHANPGSGLYLRIPDVPADGWYWMEQDGTVRKLNDDPPRLPLP